MEWITIGIISSNELHAIVKFYEGRGRLNNNRFNLIFVTFDLEFTSSS